MATGGRKITKATTRKAQALVESLRQKKCVVVLIHDNPDPDGIAAGMALCKLVEASVGAKTVLAFGGIIGRAENKALVEALEVNLVPTSEVDFERCDAVAMVDTQPGAGNNSLPCGTPPTVVIDHHPRRPDTARAAFADVRVQYGACSTMLVEYLRALEVPTDARLATALFYGIKVDTQNLGRHASKADVAAYMYLFPMVDKRLLPKIEYPRLPREYFETLHAALESAQVHDGIVLARLEEVGNPNVVAEVADFLLRLEGVTWSVCLGLYEEQLFVSVRTTDPEANAHEVVTSAIGAMGSGGGHGMLAGGRMPVPGQSRRERALLLGEMARRFLSALEVADWVGEPLLRPKRQRVEQSR